MANISFNLSGEWDDVRQVLRHFSAETILKRISSEAIALQKSIDTNNRECVKWVEYELFNSTTRVFQKQKSVITVWGMINLAFYTVVASNDYRGYVNCQVLNFSGRFEQDVQFSACVF